MAEDEGGSSDESTDEEEASPLLPIFDSSHLDSLPIYALTHTVRLLVVSRCDTVLSWEQLRSPQVSQFLIKPIQQEVRTNHFSAASIYCLMANCLQFKKEVTTHPGNSGTCLTRAMICELVAIKLLKEYSTRALIDVLSYDFDPLQGQGEAIMEQSNDLQASWQASRKSQPKSVRISCMEIAIRAQAKQLLAHPLVVQQLEAIWDGSIVFHSAADNMHRRPQPRSQQPNYGTNNTSQQERKGSLTSAGLQRKTVTLYNPRDASLFKLSRLRVPRYRNVLSTMSFAVLLGLFIAVLVQRSLEITSLEVFFWFWAGGYMLDEIVGFNEQGFGLYIASFWNTFDLGILLLLLVHLSLRMYGILMTDVHKHAIANTAYDILAADAILLFPRLFSVLDHYRYFSQLIIAFRMMANDLMAVLILIIISCSGFFVALSLSFGSDGTDNPSSVAYALLQMLMGFTPAVWDRWDSYTPLGRAILTLFLFICHFLVVTILITVLTNSFMAVVRNANEEHQFLFAVNTISNVKSDALFCYVAPLNVLQWLLAPLRYILPFRQYIKVNRTAIKLTHFPILFSIYLYEKLVLSPSVVDRIDVIEARKHSKKTLTKQFTRLARVPSVATFRQDQALEEVFRQPFDTTLRTGLGQTRRQSSNVVNNWMDELGEDLESPPQEEDPKIVSRLERRRGLNRNFSAYSRSRNISGRTTSVLSDPADLTSQFDFFSQAGLHSSAANTTPAPSNLPPQQDPADGDDELLTNDIEEDDRMTSDVHEIDSSAPPTLYASDNNLIRPKSKRGHRNYQGSRGSPGRGSLLAPPSGTASPSKLIARRRPRPHMRNVSSATMIYNPPTDNGTDGPYSAGSRIDRSPQGTSYSGSGMPYSKQAVNGNGRKQSKQKNSVVARPGLVSKQDPLFRSTPNLQAMHHLAPPSQDDHRTPLEMDLVSDIGDNKAIGGGYVGAIPASLVTQMIMAKGGLRQVQQDRNEQQQMLSRVMMARMNSLEEGFREVIHEVRENLRSNTPSRRSRSLDRNAKTPTQMQRERRKGKEKQKHDDASIEGSPLSTPVYTTGDGQELAMASAYPDSPALEDKSTTTTQSTKSAEQDARDT